VWGDTNVDQHNVAWGNTATSPSTSTNPLLVP